MHSAISLFTFCVSSCRRYGLIFEKKKIFHYLLLAALGGRWVWNGGKSNQQGDKQPQTNKASRFLRVSPEKQQPITDDCLFSSSLSETLH